MPKPPGTLTTTWSKVSGPGTVTFGNANALSTTAALSAAGNYTLRLSASDGALSASDDVVVTVKPANQPPTVNAGPDQSEDVQSVPTTVVLQGDFSDDRLPDPPGRATATWTVISGPGTVTFSPADVAITLATFSAAGTYHLRLTVNDSALSASDDMIVTIAVVP